MDPSNLLRAIAAAPDDDAPRLVYADWLEQQGDPRGELIAVQCALAGLSGLDAGRRAALEAREKELLGAHKRRWLSELGLTPGEGTFRRGFVEEVNLGHARLLQVHEMLSSAPAPIRGLRLHAAPGDAALKIARLMELSFLDRLARLSLKSMSMSEDGAKAVARSAHLRGLSFLGLKTSEAGFKILGPLFASPHLGALTSLDLSFSNLKPEGAKLLDASPHLSGNLTHLYLGSSRLATEGALALLSSRNLLRLAHLDLSGNEIEGDRALVSFAPLTELVSLNLSGNGIRLAQAVTLSSAPGPARLLELNLSYNEIGDEGAKALAAMPHLARLTTLHLWSSGLGPAGAQALASSPHFANLTSLSLGQNRIGPEGALALASSPSLARVERLDLWDNQLGDKGVKALASAPGLAALTQLDLGKNAIRSTGARALASSPFVARLTELDLRFNAIGDDGAAALASSIHLDGMRQLNLRGCSIADKFVGLLHERFGDRVLL